MLFKSTIYHYEKMIKLWIDAITTKAVCVKIIL